MASQGRKRVDAVDSGSSSVFVRAKDGSAFARRQDCNKDVPVALISMHNCSLEAKIKMNLGLFCFKKPSTTNPLFTFLASSSRALPRSPSWSCFLDAKEGRYNPKMSPKIPRERWRKGSQLITLVRKQAEVIVDDDVIFSAFKKYCKRRPPIDTRKGKLNLKLQKQHNCIPDEHYVQTLLAAPCPCGYKCRVSCVGSEVI